MTPIDSADRPREALAFLRENMYERMDAFVAVNADARREFQLQRYHFAVERLKSASVAGIALDAASARAVSLNQIDNLIRHKKRLESDIARARHASQYRFVPTYHAMRRWAGLER